MSRKIIIDTDPGIDDAMAIFLALKSPELDLLGLTTIFGNVRTPRATLNALKLLDIAGRPDIPVAQGANHALIHNFDSPAEEVHGADGQGNLNLPPTTRSPVTQSAAQFIVDAVLAHPGEVTLVPIGPLTNIALALRLEPRIVDQVAEIVLMGGNAFAEGNVNPAAEANIFHDPEAADVVFGAGWKVTMVGLDVTHRVFMSTEQMGHYTLVDDPMAQHIARILPVYTDFHKQYYGLDGIHVHDSTAIAYLLIPDAFTVEQLPIRVETQGMSRGKTWALRRSSPFTGAWDDRPPVNICVGVDAERTLALELERVVGK